MSEETKSERTAKMEFTAAQEFSHWFHGLMRHYTALDLETMKEVVDKVWVKDGPANTWLSDIDRLEVEDKEPDERTLRRFAMDARLQFNLLRNNPPMRTGMYMLVPKQAAKDIRLRFYEDGTSVFTHGHQDGRTATITGPRGSGKTHLAVFYALVDGLRNGMEVVGNIPLLGEVPGYHYSERMTETMIIICQARLEGRHTCRLYDEVQLSQKVMRVASHSYQTQADIWALERKLGSMTFAILQRESQIPKELRDFADLRVHKPSARDKSLMDVYEKRSRRFEAFKGVRGGARRAEEILESGVMNVVPEMDSFGYGLFVVDFEYPDFYKFMVTELGSRKWADEPISTRQLRLTIEYMERVQDEAGPIEQVLTDEQRALAIKEIKDRHPDRSLEEIAAMFGWGRGKARSRLAKIEAG